MNLHHHVTTLKLTGGDSQPQLYQKGERAKQPQTPLRTPPSLILVSGVGWGVFLFLLLACLIALLEMNESRFTIKDVLAPSYFPLGGGIDRSIRTDERD